MHCLVRDSPGLEMYTLNFVEFIIKWHKHPVVYMRKIHSNTIIFFAISADLGVHPPSLRMTRLCAPMRPVPAFSCKDGH